MMTKDSFALMCVEDNTLCEIALTKSQKEIMFRTIQAVTDNNVEAVVISKSMLEAFDNK